jgi:hypothetical protein
MKWHLVLKVLSKRNGRSVKKLQIQNEIRSSLMLGQSLTQHPWGALCWASEWRGIPEEPYVGPVSDAAPLRSLMLGQWVMRHPWGALCWASAWRSTPDRCDVSMTNRTTSQRRKVCTVTSAKSKRGLRTSRSVRSRVLMTTEPERVSNFSRWNSKEKYRSRLERRFFCLELREISVWRSLA